MAYGIDKDMGGDSPGNTKWMEKCVDAITGTNKRTGETYTKGEKIAICKSQLKRNKSKAAIVTMKMMEDMDDVKIDDDTSDEMDSKMETCIRREFGKGKSMAEAKAYCHDKLEKSDFDLDRFTFILDRSLFE